MERTGFLAHVEANSRIVCPNPACKAEFDGDQRIELMSTGRWLQPHKEWPPNGRVKGEALGSAPMGFVIHAVMEFGRASGRERVDLYVETSVGPGSCKKKKKS